MLDREQQTTLNDLRWHWDDAYKIDCEGGIWTAISNDHRRQFIQSDSSVELRELLHEDYRKFSPGRRVSQPDGRGT